MVAGDVAFCEFCERDDQGEKYVADGVGLPDEQLPGFDDEGLLGGAGGEWWGVPEYGWEVECEGEEESEEEGLE